MTLVHASTKKMNANAIYNSIGEYDEYGHLRAYNDTVDPRRSHTLCGSLNISEKARLRFLIRKRVEKVGRYHLMLLDIMDGNRTLHDGLEDIHGSYVITSCYHVPGAYSTPWIYHNNPQVITLRQPSNNMIQADYIVADDDDDDRLIFPAVAEVILAEITLGRIAATIDWSRISQSHVVRPRYIERWMRGERNGGFTHANDPDIHDLITRSSQKKYTIRDVFNYFKTINKLVGTPDIWRVFESALIRSVDAPIVRIIQAIRKTRVHKVWLTLFWKPPRWKHDICIATFFVSHKPFVVHIAEGNPDICADENVDRVMLTGYDDPR
jgi:hypothetical protein